MEIDVANPVRKTFQRRTDVDVGADEVVVAVAVDGRIPPPPLLKRCCCGVAVGSRHVQPVVTAAAGELADEGDRVAIPFGHGALAEAEQPPVGFAVVDLDLVADGWPEVVGDDLKWTVGVAEVVGRRTERFDEVDRRARAVAAGFDPVVAGHCVGHLPANLIESKP